MTASTDDATRNGSMPMSINRVNALGASFVCSVEKTKWPVSDARMAISAVSRIADFADHDDVRVLPQNVAQAHRERQPDVRAHGDLVDAFQFVFDRLLNRDDALVNRIDGAQKCVERSGFAGTGRAGDEKNPVRLDDDFADRRLPPSARNPVFRGSEKFFRA